MRLWMALGAVGLATSALPGNTSLLKTSSTWSGSRIKYFPSSADQPAEHV